MFGLERFFDWVLGRRVFSLLILLEIGLLFAIFSNAFAIQQATGLAILNVTFGYGADWVNGVLGAYGPVSFARYQLILLANVLHPAVYASLLGGLIWALMGEGPWRVVSVSAALVAVFDWGETLMIALMVAAPLPVDADLARVSGLLGVFKIASLGGVFAILALILMRRIYRMIVS